MKLCVQRSRRRMAILRCRIHPRMELDFRQIMASNWNEAQLHEAVKREYQCPFQLKEGPLLAGPPVHDQRYRSRLSHDLAPHHFRRLVAVVAARRVQFALPPTEPGETAVLSSLSTTYSDFVRWQTELQHSERGEELWQYWRDRLKGDLVAPDLPLDYPRPERPNHQGASLKFRVPRDLSQRLRDW